MCDSCLKLFSSNTIVTVWTHLHIKHTQWPEKKKKKSPPTAFVRTHSHWLFTKPPPGGVAGFSKCSVFQPWPSGLLLLVGRGVRRRGREIGEEGACPNRGAGITRTCAGDCRGTGRRWRHTWGRACVPWSSCRPPRSACRSLPSPCRNTCTFTCTKEERPVRGWRTTTKTLKCTFILKEQFCVKPKKLIFICSTLTHLVYSAATRWSNTMK